MKITFIGAHVPEVEALGSRSYEIVHPKVTIEFEAETLQAICEEFKHFLQACGFSIEGEIGELEQEEKK